MVKAVDLVMHASDPAFVVDEGRRVLAVNQACETLLGYTADEATGLTCGDFIRATLPNGERLCRDGCAPFQRFRDGEPFQCGASAVRRKDATRVPARISSVALHGAADGPGAHSLAIVFLGPPTVETRTNGDRLRINTLGRFGAEAGDKALPIAQWPRKQAIQLLKFLSFQVGRPVHRERLFELMWPDAEPDTAWSRLKVTIHFLRQRLRECGVADDAIRTQDDSYALAGERVVIDAQLFEAAAIAGRRAYRDGDLEAALASYQHARELYRGDYMEEDLYADWCAEERERLLELYLEVINALAEIHFAQGDYASAAQECHTALVREPCRESAHRLLIQALIALNRPDRALQQFERCRTVLRNELGVEPSEETRALICAFGARGSAAPAAVVKKVTSAV